MPRIIRQGDSSIGHCWPPTVPIPNGSIQRKVFSQNLPIIVQGDQYLPHPGPCGNAPPHPVGTLIGSENVFIGGLAIIRDGDPLNCGDVANTVEGTVFCNGGGRGPDNREDPNQTFGFSVAPPFIEYPALNFHYRLEELTPGNLIFRGCDASPKEPIMYTNLTEEQTGAIFRNSPVFGAPTLPSYASDFLKQPIPILGLTFTISTDGSIPTEVIGNDLGNGIKINKDTGVIFGKPQNFFQSKTLRVNIRNFVGSRDLIFNITLSEVSICP